MNREKTAFFFFCFWSWCLWLSSHMAEEDNSGWDSSWGHPPHDCLGGTRGHACLSSEQRLSFQTPHQHLDQRSDFGITWGKHQHYSCPDFKPRCSQTQLIGNQISKALLSLYFFHSPERAFLVTVFTHCTMVQPADGVLNHPYFLAKLQ